MELAAFILTDLFFLALVVYGVSLDRRMVREEARCRYEMTKMAEQLWRATDAVEELREVLAACAEPEEPEDGEESSGASERERSHAEGIANIWAYAPVAGGHESEEAL